MPAKFFSFVFLLLLASEHSLANASEDSSSEQCVDPSAVIGARYLITEADSSHAQSFLILRETPSRVIYIMPDAHMTQIYEHYGEERIKLIEYFDLETIGVEHDPADAPVSKSWSSIHTLVGKRLIKQLTASGTQAYHCLQTTSYAGQVGEAGVELDYIESVALPRTMRRELNGQQKTWSLQEFLTDPQQLQDILQRVADYRLYDYADLGDSENEDFFRNSRYLQYKLGHQH